MRQRGWADLAHKIGMKRAGPKPWPTWLIILGNAYRRSEKRHRQQVIVKCAALVADSPELQMEIDTVSRLGGAPALSKWITHQTREPAKPEQRRQKLDRVVEKRAQHAKAMLAQHKRAMGRERQLCDRWARRVRYYEARGAYGDQT